MYNSNTKRRMVLVQVHY